MIARVVACLVCNLCPSRKVLLQLVKNFNKVAHYIGILRDRFRGLSKFSEEFGRKALEDSLRITYYRTTGRILPRMTEDCCRIIDLCINCTRNSDWRGRASYFKRSHFQKLKHIRNKGNFKK